MRQKAKTPARCRRYQKNPEDYLVSDYTLGTTFCQEENRVRSPNSWARKSNMRPTLDSLIRTKCLRLVGLVAPESVGSKRRVVRPALPARVCPANVGGLFRPRALSLPCRNRDILST